MLQYWILYKLLIRKIYLTWYKGRGQQAWTLSLLLITMNLLSIEILLEWLFGIKGFIYLSHSQDLPLGPIAMLIALVGFTLLFLFKPKRDKLSTFRIIRHAYIKSLKVKREWVVTYTIFSLIFLIFNIVIAFGSVSNG